jgi:hypothetical protein
MINSSLQVFTPNLPNLCKESRRYRNALFLNNIFERIILLHEGLRGNAFLKSGFGGMKRDWSAMSGRTRRA